MEFFEEAKAIWQSDVPKSGQARTVQGELIRAVEKFRDEAIRNGNVNWDNGFELLLQYLQQHLLDPQVFDARRIESTQLALARLQNFEEPYLNDDLYDALTDRVVEYFKHYGSKPHKKNPHLRR